MSQYSNKNFFDSQLDSESLLSQNVSTFFTNNENSQTFLTMPDFGTQDNSFNHTLQDEDFTLNEFKSQQNFESQGSLNFFNDNSRDDSMSESNEPQKNKSDSSIQYTPQCLENLISITQTNENISTMPESIVQMYTSIKKEHSDFTFTSIVAGQLCSEIFPFGAYNNLKLPLLMSLISSYQDKKLNIMAIGRETSHASIIMNYIGKFAERFLRVSTNFDGITVNSNNVIEGGAIALASNGISYLGNWLRIPQKATLKLLREIETKTILVDKIQKHFPLQTTTWAYWNFTSKIKKDLASINQFINVFGIPLIIDDLVFVEDIIDDLLNQTLTEPSANSTDFKINDEDFRSYINFAQNLSVEFDSRANIMLKNYFMATKIVRPDALSEKGYDVLKIMAESHAKMSLRKIVNRQDVLVAISFAEQYIKEFFEKDSFTSPSFRVETDSIECYDKYLSELYEWYLKFTEDILEKI